MGRSQQRARKKQPNREKISGLGDNRPTCPKSMEEFLSPEHDIFYKLDAFRDNFGLFLRKYKDESKLIVPNNLKHEQRLDFAMWIAEALLNDKEIVPSLAEIGKNFSSQADPKLKWVDNLLEGFDEAETLISYLRDLFDKDQTVLDYLHNIYRRDQVNFQTNARRALIGSIVTTRYNDDRNTIHDIDFASTPSSTAVEDNFKRYLNIDINDRTQPLLVCMEEPEDKVCMEKQGVLRPILVPELTFMAEATAADLRVKEGPNLVVMKELVVSAYRWVMEQLDLDLAEFKVFREGLQRKERERWDMLADNDVNELAATDIVKLGKIDKEMDGIITRYKIQNIDVDYIEGKSLGAVPKEKNKEKSFKSKKKRNNPDAKSKDDNANANDESLIQADITEAPYQEEESGYKSKKNRKKPDRKSKDAQTNNDLIQESFMMKEFAEIGLEDSIKTEQFKSDSDSINIVQLKVKDTLNVTKAQVDVTKNGLREEPLKNSQLNFKLTSANQEGDLSREPLKEIPVRDPNEVREEVRDPYIKDIVEVNEKVENMKEERDYFSVNKNNE